MTETFIRKRLEELQPGDRLYWGEEPCEVTQLTVRQGSYWILSLRFSDGSEDGIRLTKDHSVYVRSDRP